MQPDPPASCSLPFSPRAQRAIRGLGVAILSYLCLACGGPNAENADGHGRSLDAGQPPMAGRDAGAQIPSPMRPAGDAGPLDRDDARWARDLRRQTRDGANIRDIRPAVDGQWSTDGAARSDDAGSSLADGALADADQPPADGATASDAGIDPGAGAYQGFGARTHGGAEGRIYHVRSLADFGPGTLRDAVSQSHRWIVFDIAGTIKLRNPLVITAHALTIDGFSAPAPVTINGMVELRGNKSGPTVQASEVILRGLRFRGGYDSLRIWRNAHDIVVDHNSFSGAGDGSCDITEGAYNVTFSWNIVTKTAGEGKAMLFSYGAFHGSIHHNLWVDNEQRHPMIGQAQRQSSSGPAAAAPRADLRYNVVWDYGGLGTDVTREGSSANVVSNLYYTASKSGSRPRNHIRVRRGAVAYVAGNVCVQDCRGSQYLTDHRVTHANSMSNHDEFAAPRIGGPSTNDALGRLATWQAVIERAGPCGKGTVFEGRDDALERNARSLPQLPDATIFSQPWNTAGEP